MLRLGFKQIAFGGGDSGGGGGDSDSAPSRAPTRSPRPVQRPTPPPNFGNDRDDSPAPAPAPAPAPVRAPAPAPAPAPVRAPAPSAKAPAPTESTKRVFAQAPVPAAQPNIGRGSDPRLFDPRGTTIRSYVDPDGNLTQLGAQRVGAMAGEPANQQDLVTFEDILGSVDVAPIAPVTTPPPAPSGVASLAPAPQVMESLRPTMRPTTISLPTTSPETGERGTAEVSFQEYASLPRDEEGFLDLTSPEAQLINLDVQRPADFGTPEGFALEDALYFGEDSMRSRMQEPPTGLEGLFRGTMLGSALGPMADRQQQVAYNQLVQGPNYRGTPIQPTGNFLYDSAAGLFGDRSFDQSAANYVAVTENGQVIGSLAVDAEGNPVGYTGTRSANAQIMDPNVDAAAAASFIQPAQDAGGDGPMTTAVAPPVVDPCPEGYRLDPETQSCVLDVAAETPTQPQLPVDPGPMVPTEVTPTSGYTQLGAMPALQPLMPQPAFAIPRPMVQPVVVPAQTGLASLRT